MKIKKGPPENIDEYIAGFPGEIQKILEKLRETIRNAAPEAKETINYAVPTYKLNGNLVHFAGYKKHVGFYPTPSGITNFEKELSGFETGKGSVKFPLNKPVPYDLVAEIVAFRVKENLNKASSKI
jgi:uncharacterized protein YdhG (YjbR/CyaY superfamily)